jgi:glycosyltransferase involved in cell wall biosynthesis
MNALRTLPAATADDASVSPEHDMARPIASVVIPVKNAVSIIGQVLDAATTQVAPWSYEIIVIDSGSKDGTLEVIARYPDVRVIRIPPQEFGHGRTRNLGIAEARGDFVAFLTHDAIPNDAHWLATLVHPMEAREDIAGVFGRHIAHEGASPCVARDLRLHFEGLHAFGGVLRLDDGDRYQRDPGYRQVLHFYSDNNSCMRKSVWRNIPYPDVNYAEDQLWAKTIIERGHSKGYAHDAVVRHSHDYGVIETFRRSFDESSALKSLFGYILAASYRSALHNAYACAKRDFRYTFNADGGGLIAAGKVAVCNIAKQAGYLLGSRARPLPGWILRIVSLDTRMKYGPFSPMAAIRKFLEIARHDGLRSALSRTLGAASRKVAPVEIAPPPKIDVPCFFNAIYLPSTVTKHPVGIAVDANTANTVDALWFIPDFGAGSGGHLNIFRFVRGLEARGMRCGIVIVGQNSHPNQGVAAAKIRQYFGDIFAGVYFEHDRLPTARVAVATSWFTAYYLRHYNAKSVEKYYFIQDYEPMFYSAGFDAAAAEHTYDFGYRMICAGTWIEREIQARHGVKPLGHFGFSYDHDLYRPCGKRESIRRVFFYVRPPTPRRGFELGMLALDLVGRRCPDVEFIFAGWDMSAYRFDHVHLNCGTLSTAELPDLYSQCDVALILSFSNMSLLPYEVMACGCAVVSNDDACATWGLTPEVATYSRSTPESIADAIVGLLDDEERRKAQIERALRFVTDTSWEHEVSRVCAMLGGEEGGAA